MSEWKQGASARRDARATKDEQPRDRMGRPEPQPQQRAKKDKKRWCKGHVGREHDPVIVKQEGYWHDKPCSNDGWFGCHHTEKCENCGRRLRYFLDPKDCPELTSVKKGL